MTMITGTMDFVAGTGTDPWAAWAGTGSWSDVTSSQGTQHKEATSVAELAVAV